MTSTPDSQGPLPTQGPVPPLPTGQHAQAPGPAVQYVARPPGRSVGSRILRGIGVLLFIVSIGINLLLLMLLAGSGGTGSLETTVLEDGAAGQTVAVFAAEGTIGEEMAGEFNRFYREVQDNSSIKAVVIRVNSPGGTVSASDQIHHTIQNIGKLHKPVIVSMGGVAASGGYYISVAADEIFAEPSTITGSIGVISVWPVVKDFLSNHGVDVITIRSPQSEGFKATENFWESPTDRTRKDLQDMLGAMHTRFADIVKAGRPTLKTQEIKVSLDKAATAPAREVTEIEPLNGKIYLAPEAMKWGLVDKVGYLHDATAAAAKSAGLSNPKVVQYSKRKGLRELFGASQSAGLVDFKMVDKLMTPQILMMWKMD